MIEIVAHSTVHGASDAVQLSSEAPDFCCVVVVDDDGRPTGEIVGEYPTGKSAAMFIIADEAWASRRDGVMTFTFCSACDRPLRVDRGHPPLNRLCCSELCMARLTADEPGWRKVTDPEAVAAEIGDAVSACQKRVSEASDRRAEARRLIAELMRLSFIAGGKMDALNNEVLGAHRALVDFLGIGEAN